MQFHENPHYRFSQVLLRHIRLHLNGGFRYQFVAVAVEGHAIFVHYDALQLSARHLHVILGHLKQAVLDVSD